MELQAQRLAAVAGLATRADRLLGSDGEGGGQIVERHLPRVARDDELAYEDASYTRCLVSVF